MTSSIINTHISIQNQKDNIWRYNGAAVLINQQQEVLFCQRASTKKFKPNLRHLPGGKIEDGEYSSEGLARELSEELGISADVVCYLGVDQDYMDDDGHHHRTGFFLCQAYGTAQIDFENQNVSRVKLTDIWDIIINQNKDDIYYYQVINIAITKALSLMPSYSSDIHIS